MLSRVVVPSIPYLNYSLFKFLANHPLLVEPLVFHPISKQHVPVSSYRFMDGIPLGDGLVCSIFPGFEKKDSTSPTSTAVSVLYKTHDMGHNHDEAVYHFVVKFQFKEVNIEGSAVSTDPDLITVPDRALVDPRQRLLIPSTTQEVELVLNPSLDIIGDYMELTRLALSDVQHYKDFPVKVRSVEVVHQNFGTPEWNQGLNSFISEGYLLIRMHAFISRGWRDKFLVPLEKINLELQNNELAQAIESYQQPDPALEQGVQAYEAEYILVQEKGQPLGVATLDSQGKVLISQLPDLGGTINSHLLAPDPHPQYASKDSVQTALANKADLTHTHPISEVINLQSALDAKQDHTGILDSLNTAAPAAGFLVSNGVQYQTTNNLDGGEF